MIDTLTALRTRISETNVRLKYDFAPDVSHRRDRRDGADHGDRVEQQHADQVDELDEDRGRGEGYHRRRALAEHLATASDRAGDAAASVSTTASR